MALLMHRLGEAGVSSLPSSRGLRPGARREGLTEAFAFSFLTSTNLVSLLLVAPACERHYGALQVCLYLPP